MIALELSDQDIANFRLVCHSTNNAVDDDRNYFWRQRYNATYDPAGLSRPSSAMKSLYQLRRRWQRKAPVFSSGNSRDEKDFLQVIKGIIIGKITFNYIYQAICHRDLSALDLHRDRGADLPFSPDQAGQISRDFSGCDGHSLTPWFESHFN
jgi:hypothetical protein